jgi:alginate O-acetyltransferase complex protein AlgI
MVDLLPLAALPLLVMAFKNQMVAWIFMWALAFALYFGCKWLTYREALRHNLRPGLRRTLAYLFGWVGMDATNFLDAKRVPAKPRKIEWAFASAKMCLGIVLTWGTARLFLPEHSLMAGWTGMIGVVFVLHFGLFHLLSLAWRHVGFHTTPVMQNPIGAPSLAQFWGGRWNTAFNELAFRFTFRPLRHLTTPALATLLVFGLSGLIHDLLISLPARGGYGLPTLYFLIQGAGVIFEHSRLGRAMGLGHGVRGWFFTALVTIVPVFWLFHPPFIHHVILPMLTAIGAT